MTTPHQIERGPAFWIACGFGSGLVARAPGTAGSLVALALGLALLALEPALLPLAGAVATIGGLWAVQACGAAQAPGGDPGWVVIDEFAGQWIAMLPMALLPVAAAWNPPSIVLAFVAFRALDILKPGPVGWADRQSGAAGIMADDVIAGLLAAGILRGAQMLLPGWFAVAPSAILG
jgi:phosphatidylglycerophosphatase A